MQPWGYVNGWKKWPKAGEGGLECSPQNDPWTPGDYKVTATWEDDPYLALYGQNEPDTVDEGGKANANIKMINSSLSLGGKGIETIGSDLFYALSAPYSFSLDDTIQANLLLTPKPEGNYYCRWVINQNLMFNDNLQQYECGSSISIRPVCAGLGCISHDTTFQKHPFDSNSLPDSRISTSAYINIFYAELSLYADEGSRDLSDVGHSWWKITVSDNIKSKINPELIEYIGEAGYWPTTNDFISRGQVIMGSQSHSITAQSTKYINFNLLNSLLTYVENTYKNPGQYSVMSHNCTDVAVDVAKSISWDISLDSPETPWKLSDYLRDDDVP